MAHNLSDYPSYPVRHIVRQSPPVNLSSPYWDTWLKGKHIVITGGASGFGAGFASRWAKAGASVVIGDIDMERGAKTVAMIRSEAGHNNIWFEPCNVSDWNSQCKLFKEAVRLSSHGGIDIVVSNAGIGKPETFLTPKLDEAGNVEKPDLSTMDVNSTGVLYTTHLALHYLPKNPGSIPCETTALPGHEKFQRDRLLLLVGSIASVAPIPGQPLYGASKHAVLGLFRSLRSSSFVDGVRVNMICPYFIKTGILPAGARTALAGTAFGKIEDVVEAATRLTADQRILGRALMIGPPIKTITNAAGEIESVEVPNQNKPGVAHADPEISGIYEIYADDFENSEIFMSRVVRVFNIVSMVRGVRGKISDLWDAIRYSLV